MAAGVVSCGLAVPEWVKFFEGAGIPPGPSANYALTFVDNRINKSMLLDLTREVLHEMGISVVGDVIAIIKHAKVVHQLEVGKAVGVQGLYSDLMPKPTPLKRSPHAVASRMITSSLPRDAPPCSAIDTTVSSFSDQLTFGRLRVKPEERQVSVTVSNTLGKRLEPVSYEVDSTAFEEVPVKKNRRVTAETEGKYVVNMPKGITAKTKKLMEQQKIQSKVLQRNSVFDRLGAECKPDTTTGNKPTGVFSRLGKQETCSDDDEDDDNDYDNIAKGDVNSSSVLQYAGVLKTVPQSSRPVMIRINPPALSAAFKRPVTIHRLATPTKASTGVAGISLYSRTEAAKQRGGVMRRLGKTTAVESSSESRVSSSSSRSSGLLKRGKVAISSTRGQVISTRRKTAGQSQGVGQVSSSSSNSSTGIGTSQGMFAYGDSEKFISVFQRLGRKSS
uniref:Chromosome 19 open reading frame 47 n=2 Tax=Eptatretus burgeri TaxID=7764 RepID=A0A8C4Q753_EPTBU